jgi:hypothetical protein
LNGGVLGLSSRYTQVFGEVTAGAAGSPQSDLVRANRLAIRLETQYGFGDLGLISLWDDPTDDDLLRYDLRSVFRTRQPLIVRRGTDGGWLHVAPEVTP